MQARQYRPDSGTFLSQDRFESAGADLALQSDPLTQNRYAFAGGNPVSSVEFDGHLASCIGPGGTTAPCDKKGHAVNEPGPGPGPPPPPPTASSDSSTSSGGSPSGGTTSQPSSAPAAKHPISVAAHVLPTLPPAERKPFVLDFYKNYIAPLKGARYQKTIDEYRQLSLGYDALSTCGEGGAPSELCFEPSAESPEDLKLAIELSVGGLPSIGKEAGEVGGKGLFNLLKGVFRGGATKTAEEGARYGAHEVGPLADDVARTFRGGSYTESTVSEATTFYRVYGGKAGPAGSYLTRIKPSGSLQATLDSALNPAWGNTASRVAEIRVPAGTKIYEGAAAPQRIPGGSLLGGGNQVYIPRVPNSWVVRK